MFLTTALDTVIGVVFVFLVFSLLTSGIGEGIARAFTLRQRHLWRTLRKLVDGEAGPWNKDQRPKPGDTGTTLTDQLSEHPLIRQLEGPNLTSRSRVGHIDTGDFSRAMFDLLVPNPQEPNVLEQLMSKLQQLPEGSALRARLEFVLKQAGADLDAVGNAIGDWFDARMEWLSRVYKRHTKYLLFVIGLVVIPIFNVDAIRTTTELYRDDALRAAVAEEAASLVQTCTPTESTEGAEPQEPADAEALRDCLGDEVKEVLGDIRLPVGWPDPDRNIWLRLLGWVIAAVAMSLGAQFWYDVLRRATTLRRQ